MLIFNHPTMCYVEQRRVVDDDGPRSSPPAKRTYVKNISPEEKILRKWVTGSFPGASGPPVGTFFFFFFRIKFQPVGVERARGGCACEGVASLSRLYESSGGAAGLERSGTTIAITVKQIHINVLRYYYTKNMQAFNCDRMLL